MPTVLYYDQQGNVQAGGAEAERKVIELTAEEGQWIKSEW